MSDPVRRVVVVGGGIAGLVAAWQIEQDDPDVRVVVLEASERTGGKLWSEPFAGHVVDHGADAFLARVPDAIDLCRQIGLGDRLLSPSRREALLLVDGRAHPFPPGLVLGVPTDLDALAASGLVSPAGVARAAEDLERPDDRPGGDEAVGALVRRRLGDEVYEVLVEPLLSGINAGSADELSLEAGATQLAAAVRDQPSLIAGVRAQRTAATATDPDAPVFHSLPGGTGELARAVHGALRGEVRTGAAATALMRVGVRWEVAVEATPVGAAPPGAATLACDQVILAAPAYAIAPLLASLAPRTSAGLEALRYASAAVVLAAWPRDDVGHALDASGLLVPAREGLLTTACSFGSSKWPQWSDPDVAVLRASAGRFHDRRIDTLDDEALTEQVLAELRPILELHGDALATAVVRWDRGLPQYAPGHLERVDTWDEELRAACPGLVLCGASTRGLGIPAVIRGARAAARALP